MFAGDKTRNSVPNYAFRLRTLLRKRRTAKAPVGAKAARSGKKRSPGLCTARRNTQAYTLRQGVSACSAPNDESAISYGKYARECTGLSCGQSADMTNLCMSAYVRHVAGLPMRRMRADSHWFVTREVRAAQTGRLLELALTPQGRAVLEILARDVQIRRGMQQLRGLRAPPFALLGGGGNRLAQAP